MTTKSRIAFSSQGPPVENVGRGQPIAFKLPPKILRHHGETLRLAKEAQAQNSNRD